MDSINNLKLLKVFMFLTALHSFCVGLALIFLPAWLFSEFGYGTITENFFRVQGGVFHLVMVVAYMMAYKAPAKNKIIIHFSITAKFIATIFLITYYFFVDPVLVVLFSGIGDFTIGLFILVLAGRSNLLNHTE